MTEEDKELIIDAINEVYNWIDDELDKYEGVDGLENMVTETRSSFTFYIEELKKEYTNG